MSQFSILFLKKVLFLAYIINGKTILPRNYYSLKKFSHFNIWEHIKKQKFSQSTAIANLMKYKGSNVIILERTLPTQKRSSKLYFHVRLSHVHTFDISVASFTVPSRIYKIRLSLHFRIHWKCKHIH